MVEAYKMNKYLQRCEELLKLSNCCLIHFGCVLVKDGVIIGQGYNRSLRDECETTCLKDEIKNRDIGKNPAICYAIHSEWMAIFNALNNYDFNELTNSTLYIVGRYPNGESWKSKYFACTVCSRMLQYCGIKEVIGLQFNKKRKLSMEDVFQSAYEHILEGKI